LETHSSFRTIIKVADMVVDSSLQQTNGGSSTFNGAIYNLQSTINSFSSFLCKLPLQQLIRLVWIIGGYILLRPYLELAFRKLFATQENDLDKTAAAANEPPQKRNPVGGPLDGLEPDIAGLTTGNAAWGAAARKRQAMILQAWEKEQARHVEEHDVDGIDPDLLED
jgi:hypothetical protein